jgi:hypothetical protein
MSSGPGYRRSLQDVEAVGEVDEAAVVDIIDVVDRRPVRE